MTTTTVHREQLKALVLEAMISFLEDEVHGHMPHDWGSAQTGLHAEKQTVFPRIPDEFRPGTQTRRMEHQIAPA